MSRGAGLRHSSVSLLSLAITLGNVQRKNTCSQGGWGGFGEAGKTMQGDTRNRKPEIKLGRLGWGQITKGLEFHTKECEFQSIGY